jgi:phenylalanyl-tRNA synthetase beta chain
MKISLNWLKDYIKEDINPQELKDKFNLMSQEVDDLYKLVDAKNLVIGYVKSCKKHDNADKLNVCQVDVGNEELQIICGAPNVDKDQLVIVALPGAVLPGDFKIKKAKIRGVESSGMICSLDELGVQDFEKEEKGIYVLDKDAPIGKNPLEYMGLDDFVLDLDLTANRPDLLSMRGVAHDVKAMFDTSIQFDQPQVDRTKKDISLKIESQTNQASMYYGQVIENIKVKKSPYWLRSRLLAAGIRPINNVVDITNYVMLEYGQPLHAFDFNKVNSNQILVRQAKDNESIKTLDEVERTLLTTDIVITDGEKPIALAGVMGGYETEVDEQTNTILLESAVFDPVSVRKTSKRLALKSESSSRFEKGINHHLTKEALDRACELFVELAEGKVINQAAYFDHTEKVDQVFDLSIEKLNHVTNHDFDKQTINQILKRLSFPYEEKDGQYKVHVPYRRLKFESYQDVIEEIVRIYGYDKIGSTLPSTPTEGKLSLRQAFKRKIKNQFVGLGFYETYTYSLTSESLAKKYDRQPLSLVKIMNPITKDREFLRHSSIPALQDVLSYNLARKATDIMLFELSKRYTQEAEEETITGILQGNYLLSPWQKEKTEIDFFLVKGLLEQVFDAFKIDNYQIRKPETNLPHLHPGVSAEILINNHYVGFLGRLHPEEEKSMDSSQVFVFELDLEPIYKAYSDVSISYQAISKYPTVERDIAILVNDDIEAEKLKSTIYKISNQSLKTVNIFDVYQGQHLEDGKKSIAFKLTFENKEKTLETKDVDQMVSRIVSALEKEHQASLRQ